MWIAALLAGAALAGWNAVVTSRLWRSPMYERSQQRAQTALIWLLPGSAFLVNWLVQGMPTKPDVDPHFNDGCTDYSKQGINIGAP